MIFWALAALCVSSVAANACDDARCVFDTGACKTPAQCQRKTSANTAGSDSCVWTEPGPLCDKFATGCCALPVVRQPEGVAVTQLNHNVRVFRVSGEFLDYSMLSSRSRAIAYGRNNSFLIGAESPLIRVGRHGEPTAMDVWFSGAAQSDFYALVWSPSEGLDVFYASDSANGRIVKLRDDGASGVQTEVFKSGLSGVKGMVLSPDQRSLYAVTTTQIRIFAVGSGAEASGSPVTVAGATQLNGIVFSATNPDVFYVTDSKTECAGYFNSFTGMDRTCRSRLLSFSARTNAVLSTLSNSNVRALWADAPSSEVFEDCDDATPCVNNIDDFHRLDGLAALAITKDGLGLYVSGGMEFFGLHGVRPHVLRLTFSPSNAAQFVSIVNFLPNEDNTNFPSISSPVRGISGQCHEDCTQCRTNPSTFQHECHQCAAPSANVDANGACGSSSTCTTVTNGANSGRTCSTTCGAGLTFLYGRGCVSASDTLTPQPSPPPTPMPTPATPSPTPATPSPTPKPPTPKPPTPKPPTPAPPTPKPSTPQPQPTPVPTDASCSAAQRTLCTNACVGSYPTSCVCSPAFSVTCAATTTTTTTTAATPSPAPTPLPAVFDATCTDAQKTACNEICIGTTPQRCTCSPTFSVSCAPPSNVATTTTAMPTTVATPAMMAPIDPSCTGAQKTLCLLSCLNSFPVSCTCTPAFSVSCSPTEVGEPVNPIMLPDGIVVDIPNDATPLALSALAVALLGVAHL